MRAVHFFIEQPSSSLLAHLPYIKFLENVLAAYIPFRLVRLPGAYFPFFVYAAEFWVLKLPALSCAQLDGAIWAHESKIDIAHGHTASASAFTGTIMIQ